MNNLEKKDIKFCNTIRDLTNRKRNLIPDCDAIILDAKIEIDFSNGEFKLHKLGIPKINIFYTEYERSGGND